MRAILEYIDQKTKRMSDSNPILKYAMCIVKYCMWYLEKVGLPKLSNLNPKPGTVHRNASVIHRT
jgi:hypothetical protein